MSHLLLLPNGEQTFVDANGVPYALGTVGMYVPNTLTFKDTWQDKDHSALNSTPILLDAAGRCVIWGTGTYRQILKDLNGNTIWDKETLVAEPGIAGLTSIASVTDVLTGTSASAAVTPDSLAALWEQGANVASAATLSLGEGGFFHVTGVVTITDIDFAVDKAGREAILVFDGILTLTYNAATLILPTGANIVTAVGDCCKVVSEGSDVVRVVWYQRKSGAPLVSAIFSGAMIKLSTDQLTANYVGAAAVPFDAEDFDTDNWHDNAVNNTRMTVPAGLGIEYVECWGQINTILDTSGTWGQLYFRKNGALGVAYGNQMIEITVTSKNMATSALIPVTAGDYIEMIFAEESDASITVGSAQTRFFIKATR